MRQKQLFVRMLLLFGLISIGLMTSLSLAADVEVFLPCTVGFDAIGLPNGAVYNLDVSSGGGNYDVTVISGLDKTLTLGISNPYSITFQNPVSTSMGTYNLLSTNPQSVTPAGDMTVTGVYQSTSISGYIFIDTNGNGVKDANEPGIPDATVELLGTEVLQHKGGEVSAETIPDGLTTFMTGTTDGNGYYEFDNIPGGTFYVRATLPGGGVQESGAITTDGTTVGTADFPQAATASLPYTGR